MTSSVNIALAQIQGSPTPAENLATVRRMSGSAAQRGADVLIFPEMLMALPTPAVPLTNVAEPLTGPFVTALREISRNSQLALIAGVWERIPGDARVLNTAVGIHADGTLEAVYRKTHLFDALNVQESRTMLAGNAPPPILRVQGMPFGLAICYDLRFPELFRWLTQQGAECLVVIAAWYAGPLKEEHWLTLLRARAIENTCYVVGVNLTGGSFCGRSAVFDPFGVRMAEAGEAEQMLTVSLDRARVIAVREKLPALQHRRPDLFPN